MTAASSGAATISSDGGMLIVSNLVNGVDTYAIPPPGASTLISSFHQPQRSFARLLSYRLFPHSGRKR